MLQSSTPSTASEFLSSFNGEARRIVEEVFDVIVRRGINQITPSTASDISNSVAIASPGEVAIATACIKMFQEGQSPATLAFMADLIHHTVEQY